jgi:hypothetical protein
MTVPLPTINCARAVRDGGIDAMAALNEALRKAIADVPPEQAHEFKLAFGRIMGELVEEIINPAIAAFPGLDVSEAEWIAIAKACAKERCGAV